MNIVTDTFRERGARRSSRQYVVFLIFFAAASLFNGVLAKLADNFAILSEITTNIGLWIFAASLFSTFSSSAKRAAITVLVFFAMLLCGYYVATVVFFGFIPSAFVLLRWGGIAVLSPIGAVLVWHAYSDARYVFLLAAMPVSLLLLSGRAVLYAFTLSRALDIAFAVALLLLLSRSHRQLLFSILASIVLAFIGSRVSLLSLLFGGL